MKTLYNKIYYKIWKFFKRSTMSKYIKRLHKSESESLLVDKYFKYYWRLKTPMESEFFNSPAGKKFFKKRARRLLFDKLELVGQITKTPSKKKKRKIKRVTRFTLLRDSKFANTYIKKSLLRKITWPRTTNEDRILTKRAEKYLYTLKRRILPHTANTLNDNKKKSIFDSIKNFNLSQLIPEILIERSSWKNIYLKHTPPLKISTIILVNDKLTFLRKPFDKNTWFNILNFINIRLIVGKFKIKLNKKKHIIKKLINGDFRIKPKLYNINLSLPVYYTTLVGYKKWRPIYKTTCILNKTNIAVIDKLITYALKNIQYIFVGSIPFLEKINELFYSIKDIIFDIIIACIKNITNIITNRFINKKNIYYYYYKKVKYKLKGRRNLPKIIRLITIIIIYHTFYGVCSLFYKTIYRTIVYSKIILKKQFKIFEPILNYFRIAAAISAKALHTFNNKYFITPIINIYFIIKESILFLYKYTTGKLEEVLVIYNKLYNRDLSKFFVALKIIFSITVYPFVFFDAFYSHYIFNINTNPLSVGIVLSLLLIINLFMTSLKYELVYFKAEILYILSIPIVFNYIRRPYRVNKIKAFDPAVLDINIYSHIRVDDFTINITAASYLILFLFFIVIILLFFYNHKKDDNLITCFTSDILNTNAEFVKYERLSKPVIRSLFLTKKEKEFFKDYEEFLDNTKPTIFDEITNKNIIDPTFELNFSEMEERIEYQRARAVREYKKALRNRYVKAPRKRQFWTLLFMENKLKYSAPIDKSIIYGDDLPFLTLLYEEELDFLEDEAEDIIDETIKFLIYNYILEMKLLTLLKEKKTLLDNYRITFDDWHNLNIEYYYNILTTDIPELEYLIDTYIQPGRDLLDLHANIIKFYKEATKINKLSISDPIKQFFIVSKLAPIYQLENKEKIEDIYEIPTKHQPSNFTDFIPKPLLTSLVKLEIYLIKKNYMPREDAIILEYFLENLNIKVRGLGYSDGRFRIANIISYIMRPGMLLETLSKMYAIRGVYHTVDALQMMVDEGQKNVTEAEIPKLAMREAKRNQIVRLHIFLLHALIFLNKPRKIKTLNINPYTLKEPISPTFKEKLFRFIKLLKNTFKGNP